MRENLEARKLVMGNMSMRSKVVEEKSKKQEEQLNSQIRSLLMAGTSLSVASRSLQVLLIHLFPFYFLQLFPQNQKQFLSFFWSSRKQIIHWMENEGMFVYKICRSCWEGGNNSWCHKLHCFILWKLWVDIHVSKNLNHFPEVVNQVMKIWNDFF